MVKPKAIGSQETSGNTATMYKSIHKNLLRLLSFCNVYEKYCLFPKYSPVYAVVVILSYTLGYISLGSAQTYRCWSKSLLNCCQGCKSGSLKSQTLVNARNPSIFVISR